MTVRTDWPGRPTRSSVLAPRGWRERIASWLGGSLLARWDRELGAETMRADDGWRQYVEASRALKEAGVTWRPGRVAGASSSVVTGKPTEDNR